MRRRREKVGAGGSSAWAAEVAMSSASQPDDREPMSPALLLAAGLVENVIGLAASGRGLVCWRSGTASSSISMAAAAFAAAVATGERTGLGGAGGGTCAGAGG